MNQYEIKDSLIFQDSPEVGNPDLSLDEEAPTSTQSSTPTPETQPASETQPVGEPAPETPEGEPAPEKIYTLKRQGLYQELARLEREDPDFAHVLKSYIGRKAKSQYEPQLTSMQQELEQLRLQTRRDRFSNMSDEAIREKFATDPQFARDYAEFIHSDDGRLQQQHSQERERQTAVSAFSTAVDTAIDEGLDPTEAEKLWQSLGAGKYDYDPSGNMLSYAQSLALFQRDLYKAALQAPAPAQSPVQVNGQVAQNGQAPQAVQAPPDNASPDMSRGGSRPGALTRWTKAQVDAMEPEDFIRHFPAEGDWERAIAEGRVDGLT